MVDGCLFLLWYSNQSDHLHQRVLYLTCLVRHECLGLPSQDPRKQFKWDASSDFGEAAENPKLGWNNSSMWEETQGRSSCLWFYPKS